MYGYDRAIRLNHERRDQFGERICRHINGKLISEESRRVRLEKLTVDEIPMDVHLFPNRLFEPENFQDCISRLHFVRALISHLLCGASHVFKRVNLQETRTL